MEQFLLTSQDTASGRISFSGSARYLRVFALGTFSTSCAAIAWSVRWLCFTSFLGRFYNRTPAIVLLLGGLACLVPSLVLRMSAFEFAARRIKLAAFGLLASPLLVAGFAMIAIVDMNDLSRTLDYDEADLDSNVYYGVSMVVEYFLATCAVAFPLLSGAYALKHLREVEGVRQPMQLIEERALTQSLRLICVILSINFATGVVLAMQGATNLAAKCTYLSYEGTFGLVVLISQAAGGTAMILVNVIALRLLVNPNRTLHHLRLLILTSLAFCLTSLGITFGSYISRVHHAYSSELKEGYKINVALTGLTIAASTVLHAVAAAKAK